MKFTQRLLWLIIGIIMFAIISNLLVLRIHFYNYLIKEQNQWTQALTRQLAISIAQDTLDTQKLQVRETLQVITQKDPRLEYAYVTNLDGELFTHSFTQGFPRVLMEHLTPLENPLIYQTPQGKIAQFSSPLVDGLEARLYLGINRSQFESSLFNLSRDILLTTTIIGLIGLVFAWRFGQKISRPLYTLIQQIRAYGKQKTLPDFRLRNGSDPDIKHLADTFQNMISARLKIEEELRLLATTFNSDQGIIITDHNTIILRVNSAFTRITGYAANEVIGHSTRLLNASYHSADFFASLWRQLAQNGRFQGELWSRRKNGEIFPSWQTITAVNSPEGKVTHYVGIFSDISEQKANEQKIHALAYYDSLTGLANRPALLERLDYEIAHAKRNHHFGTIILLDLDHFKMLNDSLGHLHGDKLLQQVSNRLQNLIREEDMPTRLGGDEFVVLLHADQNDISSATKGALTVADKIIKALSQPYRIENREHYFSTSLGITLYPQTDKTNADLIQQADIAMYQAKAMGRNQACFFDPVMQAQADQRLIIEQELRKALEDRQFEVHYQPQFNADGALIGAEALLRWRHPERGMIAPSHFIPLAEDTGLIVPLGEWLLDTVCQQIKMWEQQNFTIEHVAVNVSSRQFKQTDFIDFIQRTIQRHQIPFSRIMLELTESAIIENIDKTIAKMTTLKQLGIAISLDDFGTGYSSLSYLKQLPIDQLKIDKSFIDNIVTDNDELVIVTMIIAMAQLLKLNVIAEGVEVTEQLTILNSKGCHYYQGFYFSQPVPPEIFPEISRECQLLIQQSGAKTQ